MLETRSASEDTARSTWQFGRILHVGLQGRFIRAIIVSLP